MIKATKVQNAQVKVESGNVSAIVFLNADKSVSNINDGRYEVEGVIKATFGSYGDNNLSVNFQDYDNMVETLEGIKGFISEVKENIKDTDITF